MAIRSIRIVGDEVLRKRSKEVIKFDDRLSLLLEDMKETMTKSDGVGLAAPQVGVLKRVMIVNTGQGLVEFVNPRIVSQEGEHIWEEGCLSIPGKSGKVCRPKKVVISAKDRAGRDFELNGIGLMAVAICHEIDHLDGILFTDKVMEVINDDES